MTREKTNAELTAEVLADPEIKASNFHSNLLQGFVAVHKKVYIATPERIAEVAAILPEVYDDVMHEIENMEEWIAEVKSALADTRKVRAVK